jgi:Bardet-Biedl syndrome 2 protein
LQKKVILENLEELAIKESNKTKKNSPKDEIVLPKNTEIKIDLNSNKENKCADLIIESSPEGTVIHSVIIMSEQIYKGESYVKFPSRETNKVVIQIKTKKDMQINLHIKVLVGKSYYLHDYQIFEYNKIIPKYCFYILLRDEIEYKDELIQGVSFPFNERIERLILWIEMNLNISKKELESFKIGETEYKIRFNSLRTDKILQISVKDNTLSIFTEEIELAGNILQDMFEYFKLKEFNTSINYTEVVKSFTSTIDNIQRLDNERNQYNINMTEIITFIKDLYVRAEDNRLIDNIQNFKDYFRKINLKNMELLDEFEKRSARFEELINDLKKINEIIMTFSNLKVGRFKNEIVNQCRNCIRKKNYKLLIKIISTGGE